MSGVQTDKAELILAAALELFERKGFDGTAVPELARRAGVGTGTIYRYFATKEALLNALYQRWKAAYNGVVLAEMPADLDIRERFGLYWRRMAGFAQAEPRATRFMELHHHAAYLDETSRALARRYQAVAMAFIDEGVRAGVLKPLAPDFVVALMWGALVGMVKICGDLTPTLIAEAEDCLWDAVKAKGAVPAAPRTGA